MTKTEERIRTITGRLRYTPTGHRLTVRPDIDGFTWEVQENFGDRRCEWREVSSGWNMFRDAAVQAVIQEYYLLIGEESR